MKNNNQHISLMDIDNDIYLFLKEKVDLKIKENDNIISVPLYYADTEKWNLILNNKPIYDKKKKLILPILVFKRNSDVNINDQYPKLNLLQHTESNMFLVNSPKYTKHNDYIKSRIFNNNIERKTLEFIRIPTHVTLSYSIILYTRYIEQANTIIEYFTSINNTSYGNKYNHTFKISSMASDAQIELEGNRLIKTEIILDVNSIILSEQYNNKPNLFKKPNITKLSVVFIEKELDSTLNNNNAYLTPEIVNKNKSTADIISKHSDTDITMDNTTITFDKN